MTQGMDLTIKHARFKLTSHLQYNSSVLYVSLLYKSPQSHYFSVPKGNLESSVMVEEE